MFLLGHVFLAKKFSSGKFKQEQTEVGPSRIIKLLQVGCPSSFLFFVKYFWTVTSASFGNKIQTIAQRISAETKSRKNDKG